MTTQLKINRKQPVEITWEPLPAGFRLEDEPVENTGQPLIAVALRESLEIAQRIQPQMLIATNFALCATWLLAAVVAPVVSNLALGGRTD